MNFNFGANIGNATTNGLQLSPLSIGTLQATEAPQVPSVSTPSNLAGSIRSDTISTALGDASNPQQQNGSFWSKDGGAGIALAGIQTLGNLWNSFQSHKMAKQQMAFAREQWDTNLTNQKQTYNTALEDRIRARHHTEGRGSGDTDAYLSKHSL